MDKSPAPRNNIDADFRTLIGNTARSLRGIQCFDTAACWDELRPVLHDPPVLRELHNSMTHLCKRIGRAWEPAKGPWYYSSLPWRWVPGLGNEWAEWLRPRAALASPEAFSDWLDEHRNECQAWLDAHRPPAPEPDSLRWYQCFGYCGYLAFWQHAIAERLWPEHLWKVCPCRHPLTGHHYLVLGWPRKRKRHLRVFDVLWQPYCLDQLIDVAGDVAARLSDVCAA